jgi:hypothetical protein
MSLRLRQVALVAADLDAAVEELQKALDIEVGFRDPGVGLFGLRNAVLPAGDSFVEVVSPVEPGTTAGRWLERRGGDAGYMVIVQCDDVDAARARAESAGVRVVWETSLEAENREPEAATIHLHPRDVGGAILSLDTMRPADGWRWAGPAWRDHVRTSQVSGLAGAVLAAADPEAMAARWAAVLGAPALTGADACQEIALDGSLLRFVPSRESREGLVGVLFSGSGSTHPGVLGEVCNTCLERV